MILLRLYEGGMKRQKVLSKKYLIIDSEDYEKIKHMRLSVTFHHKKHVTSERIHRIIKNAKENELVDHINGDSLDNRRCNLRICSNKQNSQNRLKHKKNSFKGVMKVSEVFYYARINQRIIGRFNNAIDAACLNFEKHDVLNIYDNDGELKKEFEKFVILQDEDYINEHYKQINSKCSYQRYLENLKNNHMSGWRVLNVNSI